MLSDAAIIAIHCGICVCVAAYKKLLYKLANVEHLSKCVALLIPLKCRKMSSRSMLLLL